MTRRSQQEPINHQHNTQTKPNNNNNNNNNHNHNNYPSCSATGPVRPPPFHPNRTLCRTNS